jgi:type II secretory pathway pseudopilin PulG
MKRRCDPSPRRTRHPHKVRRGFTLVEAIAAMTTIAIVGTVSSSMIWVAVNAQTSAASTAQLSNETSAAMEFVIVQLRGIPRLTGQAAPDISSVTPTSIRWSTNSSLVLSGTNLMYIEAGTTPRILLSDVSTFTLQAYDDTNTALATTLSGTACDPIRRFSVTVTLTRGGASETLRSKVYLRSLMSGT